MFFDSVNSDVIERKNVERYRKTFAVQKSHPHVWE